MPTTGVVRAIDAVTAKAEVATQVAVDTVALQMVAAVQTAVPNIILAQDAVSTLVETDLRLALNGGLDELVLDALAAAGSVTVGTDPLLVNIRKGITAVQAAGYSPDTLILRPEDAEALDTLVTGLSGGKNDYVFVAGRFAPGQLFGLNVRVSLAVEAPVVADAASFGRLYIAPVSLARFEEDAGKTNRSTVRLETNAVFGTEREDAAVFIGGTS